MNLQQPEDGQQWADTYIKLVTGDLVSFLTEQAETWPNQLQSMAGGADYAYAPGKWTVKEMAGHVIDTERILVYRLTAFARGEKAELPGFDENEYVREARFQDRSLQSLAEEFALLRKANLFLFQSLNEAELEQTGIASGRTISVKTILHVIGGHVAHHSRILKERYL